MAETIRITGLKPLDPVTSPSTLVQIDFVVLGILPDVVQVFAGGVSGDIGALVKSIVMTPPENSYSAVIDLMAGSVFFIAVCPRTASNNVLDPEFDGEYWEHSCTWSRLITPAPPPPIEQPRPKPSTPSISSLEPLQATLKSKGRIVVRWTSPTVFDQYHVMWGPQYSGNSTWFESEIDSKGNTGFFTASPVAAGYTYHFKVQGCHTKTLGLNDCSDFSAVEKIVMPLNTNSLREFLRLSDVRLNPGVRSLGTPVYSGGVRRMMLLSR